MGSRHRNAIVCSWRARTTEKAEINSALSSSTASVCLVYTKYHPHSEGNRVKSHCSTSSDMFVGHASTCLRIHTARYALGSSLITASLVKCPVIWDLRAIWDRGATTPSIHRTEVSNEASLVSGLGSRAGRSCDRVNPRCCNITTKESISFFFYSRAGEPKRFAHRNILRTKYLYRVCSTILAVHILEVWTN